jgi:phosphoenolpyruvate carboxylase
MVTPRDTIAMEVIEMAKSNKWLSEEQVETIKKFGRKLQITQRSGVIRNSIYYVEDVDYGYTYSPTSLIKEVEEVAKEFAEKGLEVYVQVDEGVEVAGLVPGAWDGEFVSWDLEE